MFYQPLVLNDTNWTRFKGNLGSYPVRLSHLSKLESTIQAKSIALKYVHHGNEKYLLGKETHDLTDNQFLLVNKFSSCDVSINYPTPSYGICIDLREDYFSDAMASMYAPDDIDNLNAGARFFLSEELYSHSNRAKGTLQQLLRQLVTGASKRKLLLNDDFFRDITYAVIRNQRSLVKEYNRLPAVKTSTKKELYARLLKAKSILQDRNLPHLSIREVGKAVCLSEFRFHHLFSKTFGISPLQFQLKSILQDALIMHRKQSMPWVEIAEKTGFADIQTFSKSFKKVFGASPRNFELK